MLTTSELEQRLLAAFHRRPLDDGMHALVGVMQVLREPPSSPVRRFKIALALHRLCAAGELQAIRANDGVIYFKRRRWTPGFKAFGAYGRPPAGRADTG